MSGLTLEIQCPHCGEMVACGNISNHVVEYCVAFEKIIEAISKTRGCPAPRSVTNMGSDDIYCDGEKIEPGATMVFQDREGK